MSYIIQLNPIVFYLNIENKLKLITKKGMVTILGYLFIFIANFIFAYFIYDDPSFVKPLLHSISIVIISFIMDLVSKRKREKLNKEL
ncbi:hypothetical protein A8L34_12330 [Bacillus sp. FJAT-27264]|nr:hypothetical protein A8L34_12330 [Bacillus sp. FJAT-27264]